MGFFGLSVYKDEKVDGVKDAATNVSRAVSRRDMATQMSPEGSTNSSPNMGPSLSESTSSIMPVVELQSAPTSKLEVRDVQVDERVTMTRWSKKHKARFPGKGSEIVDNWKKKDADARSPAWDLSETAKNISKYAYFYRFDIYLFIIIFLCFMVQLENKTLIQINYGGKWWVLESLVIPSRKKNLIKYGMFVYVIPYLHKIEGVSYPFHIHVAV